jgi:hypothetical protein
MTRQRFIVEFDAAACSDETDFAARTPRSSCTQVRMPRWHIARYHWPRPECPFYPFLLASQGLCRVRNKPVVAIHPLA